MRDSNKAHAQQVKRASIYSAALARDLAPIAINYAQYLAIYRTCGYNIIPSSLGQIDISFESLYNKA